MTIRKSVETLKNKAQKALEKKHKREMLRYEKAKAKIKYCEMCNVNMGLRHSTVKFCVECKKKRLKDLKETSLKKDKKQNKFQEQTELKKLKYLQHKEDKDKKDAIEKTIFEIKNRNRKLYVLGYHKKTGIEIPKEMLVLFN